MPFNRSHLVAQSHPLVAAWRYSVMPVFCPGSSAFVSGGCGRTSLAGTCAGEAGLCCCLPDVQGTGRVLPAGREGGTLGAAFQGGLSMKTSTERILTTHTGSLPRPAGLADRHDPGAVRAAVRETVTRQWEAGV